MEQEIAALLKENLSIGVYAYRDGWKPVPAKIQNGAIVIDMSQNTPSTRYRAVIDFAQRFHEIGSGSILVNGQWVPIYHQTGLDTRWDLEFAGNALLQQVRYTLRTGEHIPIDVRYVGTAPAAEDKKPALTLAVRTGYQLVNLMWRSAVEGGAQVCVVVTAVEEDGEYIVESLKLPATVTYLAVDKLAKGRYSAQVTEYNAMGKEVAKSERILFEIVAK